MRPFNLIEALNGCPVCTASGRVIAEIHRFSAASNNKVYGVTSNGTVLNWNDDGVFGLGQDQADKLADWDLRMVDKDGGS